MRLCNIKKKYTGMEKAVFDGFSADIRNNAVTWITGRSGAGKTTLLRIIAGLEDYSGSISDFPFSGVSMVFQEDRLFEELTPAENCLLANPHISAGEAAGALFKTGLSREEISRPAKQLSGGQKRRTAIVRAVLSREKLLLLDEPFKGIDADNRLRTAELVKSLANGKTVIAVTHDPADAELIKGDIINIAHTQ